MAPESPLQARMSDVELLTRAGSRIGEDEDLDELNAILPGLTSVLEDLLDHFADARMEGIISPEVKALARVIVGEGR